MAKLIGTAGHVDHGKTTLIKALTGIDADRLPEEKKRGMTIDIGFAYLDLPPHGRVSIVDVPGHERFIHNMLVGAQGIDVALLCVAADESVMPQTREHFQILELLPVDRMVVALTKSDTADEETREIAKLEVEELLGPTRFKGAPIVEVSAVKGAGLDALKAELARALTEEGMAHTGTGTGPNSDRGPRSERRFALPWYLPIDRAFAVKGHGVVVTGTLAQGVVKVGDRAIIEPGHVGARVRAIHSHGEPLDRSEPGRRTALNLGGLKMDDVHRGQAVGEPGALFETSMFDAKMRWLCVPRHAQRVRVSIGSEEVIAKAFLSATDPQSVQFRLEAPVACALGQALIVRRYSPPELLGGGQVTVPQARPRRRSESPATPVERRSDAEAVLQVLSEREAGLPTAEIARSIGRTEVAIAPVLEELKGSGAIVGFAGQWFEQAAFAAAAERFLTTLSALHERNPSDAMLPRERVAEAANLKWSGKPFDRIVAKLAEEGRLVVSGTQVRLPTHGVRMNDRQRALLDRVLGALDAAGVNVPSPDEIALQLRVPRHAVQEILRLGLETGEIARVSEGIYYSKAQIERFKAELRDKFGTKPFPAAALRDAFGTTRKYAIPLLEYFDAVRFTLRLGDNRVVQSTEN